MRRLLKTLGIIAGIYVAVLFAACGFQRHFIFYPGHLERNYAYDLKDSCSEVFLKTPDGAEINGLFYKTSSDKVILYFHGNAGDLSSWQHVHTDIQKNCGYNFMIIDYRGYGKSTDKITEDGLYDDAQAAYSYLVLRGFKPENIIVYGRSIGTGIAAWLAAHNTVHSLVLETPYYNFGKLAHEQMPWLLPRVFLVYRFRTDKNINYVHAPVLFLHGTDDELIPTHHSQLLYDHFEGADKKLVIIPGGHHNDLKNFPEFHAALKAFLAR